MSKDGGCRVWHGESLRDLLVIPSYTCIYPSSLDSKRSRQVAAGENPLVDKQSRVTTTTVSTLKG